MKTNLNLSEDEIRSLFNSQVMTEKKDVISNVHWQITSAQEELENADIARAPFLRTLITMLGRFEKLIEETPMFAAPSDYWAYSFEIASLGITLNLEHYSYIRFDEEKNIEDSEVDATFPLMSVKSSLLSVDDFAKLYNVKTVSVRQWIRRGKLRTAVKSGTEWRIPELTEFPARGYRPARYEWTEQLSGLSEEYKILAEYNAAEFTQDGEDKNLYHVLLSGDEGERTINCNIKAREQLELMLISNPLVTYVSDSFGLFA